MAESGAERTEAPTAKRLKKARDEGNILKSRELASALVILIGCGWMVMMGPALLGASRQVMRAGFTFNHQDVEHFEPFRPVMEAGRTLAPSLAVLFAVAVASAILSQALLSGVDFNPKLLQPKPSKMNPLSGIKRIFGFNGWIELGKSLLKVVLLGAIGFYMLWGTAQGSLGLVSSDLNRAVVVLGDRFMAMMFAMAGGLVLIAGIDVPIQAVRRINALKMTKEEVKEEHKEAEGSPELKSAIRAKQRAVLKRSFRKAVAEAHVVLTNPTHFAVALRYDRFNDLVPVLVAKGRGETALAIRELAAELQVPVFEYPALARAVYYTSKENQEIRDDLYLAVATVLAFVFNVNQAAGGSPPPISVPDTARFDENGVQAPTRH